MKRILFFIFLVCLCFCEAFGQFHVSADGHYLLASDGKPLFVCACTAWTLPSDYTMDEARTYLDCRRAQGFNAIQMSAVFSEIDKEAYKRAFRNEDILKPVESYWLHVDSVVNEATQRGLLVIINPIWKRSVNDFIKKQGVEKCHQYGAWLASRYKDNPRVCYFIGGDQVPEPVRDEIDAMGKGVQSVYDGQAIVAYHSRGSQSSREAFPNAKWLTWNWTYAYTPSYKFEGEPRYPYQMNYEQLQRFPDIPIHFGEGYYDFGTAKQYSTTGSNGRWGNRRVLRRQAWWNALSGATGVAYGAEGIWHKDRDGETWQRCLEYESGRDMVRMKRLLEQLPWWKLRPDMKHRVLTDGYGKYLTDDYATAAVAEDSSFMIVYSPVSHELEIKIPKGHDHWAEHLFWYDPSNERLQTASNYSVEGGLLRLPTPGKNDAGDDDWVLVVGDTLPVFTAPRFLPYTVPFEKQVRVIVSTDAANEVDDAFFIMHALLTPQFDVCGVVASNFGNRKANDMQLSYDECQRILEKAGLSRSVTLLKGAAKPLKDTLTANPSDGADLIWREAMRDDPRPLYVLCGGALTDVASAYLQHPEISGRLTVVWTGGGPHDGSANEFNLRSDVNAANVVLGSPMAFWQIPNSVYGTVRTGSAELARRVRPCGEIGRYLFDTMMAFNDSHRTSRGWPRGEDWTLGDNPTVTVLLDTYPDTDKFDLVPAPRITKDLKYEPVAGRRKIRVYKSVDVRMILADLFSKLSLAYE